MHDTQHTGSAQWAAIATRIRSPSGQGHCTDDSRLRLSQTPRCCSSPLLRSSMFQLALHSFPLQSRLCLQSPCLLCLTFFFSLVLLQFLSEETFFF